MTSLLCNIILEQEDVVGGQTTKNEEEIVCGGKKALCVWLTTSLVIRILSVHSMVLALKEEIRSAE